MLYDVWLGCYLPLQKDPQNERKTGISRRLTVTSSRDTANQTILDQYPTTPVIPTTRDARATGRQSMRRAHNNCRALNHHLAGWEHLEFTLTIASASAALPPTFPGNTTSGIPGHRLSLVMDQTGTPGRIWPITYRAEPQMVNGQRAGEGVVGVQLRLHR